MIKAIIAAPFIWPLCFLFRLIFIITGPFFVTAALLAKAYRTEFNKFKGNNGLPVYIFTWRIMAPWQNYSDGFCCTTYYDYGFFLTSLHWSCVRNVTSGLRWTPIYSVKPEESRVKFVGSYSWPESHRYKNKTEPHWWYCWQGLYSGLFLQFKFLGVQRIWIGHKLDPRDSLGIDPTDYRVDGAAFTTQWKRNP